MFNLRHDVRKPQARQLRSDSQQMPLIAGFASNRADDRRKCTCSAAGLT